MKWTLHKNSDFKETATITLIGYDKDDNAILHESDSYESIFIVEDFSEEKMNKFIDTLEEDEFSDFCTEIYREFKVIKEINEIIDGYTEVQKILQKFEVI